MGFTVQLFGVIALADYEGSSEQIAFMTCKLEELAKKAKLSRTPELCISNGERFASVDVFRNRISIGGHLVSMWQQGRFSDEDVEATLAHEIGHLMDFRRDSHSSSFRNMLCESLWFSFGIFPLVFYLLAPSFTSFLVSGLIAVGWGSSLPWVVRRVEVRIELEADRNAGLHLVEPQHLANALVKISSFSLSTGGLGLTAKLAISASMLTHPSFVDRVRFLQSL